ncbi:MAG: sigma-70 family RNA polymerase sigma factor [Muribaculaceae bacterium]|nr:sigma-70 family RNA polymerase sigma factor [Muribaculaceae bacterium]
MENNLTSDFERLVMEQKSTIYSVCYMFTDTRTDADDLFQEVLICLWKGFDSFRGDSNIRSWVYRVSMNTCISYKRKKRVKTVPLDLSPDVLDNNSPQGKQASMLHARISRLEPFDRAIVLLWLENLPYDEIAAITGISAKNVGVRLLRIKEKLKSL